MNVTVYRQASVTRDDGTVVFKGEDARPCVGESFFFVADGMGGGAAIRHQKFDPDLFDREKLMDALFETVYEDYSDERFVRYVTGSFEELYAVRNCYTANVYNMKKSGFFGGRLAAAIFLHMAVYGEVIGPVDRLFDDWAALPGEPERETFLEKLSGDVTGEFREKLQAIAQKANLVYESGIRGMDLLGTTLTATLFRETDDGVEALYLTAGDSRPYAWSAEEGLGQLLPDQERGDGGMTNRITANKDFRIHCSILTFRKPCVLFNASDGCFDSDYFRLSQMAFEKLLLERACAATGTEEMGRLLTEDFTTMGTHDDSSTIAMKIFGYEAFEDFQADARKRLDILEAEYLSRLDGLLEKDFDEAKKEQEKQLPERLAALKTGFEEEPAVAAFCRTAVESGAYPPYNRECETLAGKEAELNARLDRLTNMLREQIRRCYSCFLSDMELNMLRQERWTPLP